MLRAPATTARAKSQFIYYLPTLKLVRVDEKQVVILRKYIVYVYLAVYASVTCANSMHVSTCHGCREQIFSDVYDMDNKILV
jgi:hypothetical protein